MGHGIEYTIQSHSAKKGNLGYEAVRIGKGAYAQVYLAKERRLSDAEPMNTQVAVKVFHDELPEDASVIFNREIEILNLLRGHQHVVGLRGVEERRPPTFVCGACPQVFSVKECPECGGELYNEDELVKLPRRRVILQCKQKHTYQKATDSFDRLLSKRPCGHTGPCDTINFLFRPCIYLDLLHVNLREYVDLLTGRQRAHRGHRVLTVADQNTRKEHWQRETFLMRLLCLIHTAEALEYIHRQEHVHGDVAHDNIMISFVPRLDNETFQIQVPALIDFGQASRVDEPRATTTTRERHGFVAPEVMTVNTNLDPSARISASAEGDARYELLCRSAEVGEGDYVWEAQGGGYEVTARLEHENPQRPDERRYALRAIGTPKGRPGDGALRVNQAVRAPADVYSFGCVVGWLITDGDDVILRQLRDAAQFAALESENIDDGLDVLRRGKSYQVALSKIPLPANEQDDEVRRKVLDIVFRCLMRIKGAYAPSRSTGFEGAASRAAKDLRTAYDQLYFIHRTADRYTEFLKKHDQAQKDAAERGDKGMLEELAKERRLREEEAAKFTERLKEATQEKNVLQRAATAAIDRAAKAAQEKDAIVAQKEQIEQQLAQLSAAKQSIEILEASDLEDPAISERPPLTNREELIRKQYALIIEKEKTATAQAAQIAELRAERERYRSRFMISAAVAFLGVLYSGILLSKGRTATPEVSPTGTSSAGTSSTGTPSIEPARASAVSAPPPPPPPSAPVAPSSSSPAAAAPVPAPRTQRCSEGYVLISGGVFLSKLEKKEYTIAPFCIGATEVSVADYFRCKEQQGGCSAMGYGLDPDCQRVWTDRSSKVAANCLLDNQAQKYCTVKGGRLPRDYEWEYVFATATRDTPPTAGADMCIKKESPCEVGASKGDRTTSGIYGLLGNTREWVTVAEGARTKVIGCSFKSGSVTDWSTCATLKDSAQPIELGFRCVQEPSPIEQ